MGSLLLAIDTSTATTGIACFCERGLLAEAIWESGRNHSAQLLAQIDLTLAQLRAGPSELCGLAVAVGPGSWSGLRVGLSTAKGMALALGLPIIGIGTLDALAEQYAQLGCATVPLIHLGRGRYAAATYSLVGEQVERQADFPGRSLDDIVSATIGPALFCGDLTASTEEQLRIALGDQALFPPPAARLRRPGYLAALAWRRLLAGNHDSLSSLEPIYLGQPVKS